ncbi:Prolyl oligopeptidase family protein [Sinosporangium album]|uniref:Prolyl oligopeptidase family protein n=1 Tax=Sinosporangium album TaxID=504805 RepID=A0A1G8KLU2_9ACTN|nr:Prolyl oligopeptidase family protein [Sinosporangium album]
MVIGPGVVADAQLLGEIAEREFAALGVSGWVVPVADADEALKAIPAGAAVVIPGPDPGLRRLMTEPRPGAPVTGAVPGVVWLDLTHTGPVDVPHGDAHLYGRGIDGLTWAIRHAVHRLRHPARRVPYGPHPDQWGDLRLPAGATPGAPVPVVAVIHGGYWRSIWAADLMDALSADLATRGFASWNIEYRRPDLHGWDATTADIHAALDALTALDASPHRSERDVHTDPDPSDRDTRAAASDRDAAHPTALGASLDLTRLAVAGHSAGGQLALRAAADRHDIALAISLAGVLDLVEADRRHVSSGAVAAALGGTSDALPDVYAASSPLARLPLGVPTLIVQGTHDDPDLLDAARRYTLAAHTAGEPPTYLEAPGDHFSVINPTSPIWQATAAAVAQHLG